MGAGKIQYNQDAVRKVSNAATAHGDIHTHNYYSVRNIIGAGPSAGAPVSKSDALSAYLSAAGKTPAQLAKELSTTATNVKGWLRGNDIEIDYWLQLKPLLEEFLREKPAPEKKAAENKNQSPVSVDEALLVRKYRNLLPQQKMKIHKELDQMEIDNIDRRWQNAGVREPQAEYLNKFSMTIKFGAQEDFVRFIASLGDNITLVSDLPHKSGKNMRVLSVSTIKSGEYVETYIKNSAGQNNCKVTRFINF